MRFTFRLLTVLCYFLPFTFFLTTCNNGLELRFSYNQKEADSNLLLEKQSASSAADTTLHNDDTLVTVAQVDAAKQSTSNDGAQVFKRIIMPTDKSLSGIGSIFYFKNLIGKAAIATSLIIALILFVAFKFFKSQKLNLYLLLTAFLSLTIFIIDSFISNVTLLWGAWTLLVLLSLQLKLGLDDRKKAYG